MDALLSLHEKREGLLDRTDSLVKAIELIEIVITNTVYWEDLATLEEPVVNLLEQYKALEEQESKRLSLYSIVSDIKEYSREILAKETRQIVIENELKDNMPAICPLCNQKIK